MTKQNEEKLPIVPTLRVMKPGEQVVYPLSRLMSVKAGVSSVQRLTGMRLATHVDGDRRLFKVTRIK